MRTAHVPWATPDTLSLPVQERADALSRADLQLCDAATKFADSERSTYLDEEEYRRAMRVAHARLLGAAEEIVRAMERLVRP